MTVIYHDCVADAPIYLDHHATTPCDPRVVAKMTPCFTDNFGNPSALANAHGRRAAQALEDARIAVARFFSAHPDEIYFTSGATESNNIALNLVEPREHLITTAVEHRSILAPARRIESRGAELTILSPDREGFIDPEDLRAAIRPNTRLVSIETANGEIGTIQPVAELARICREHGVLVHTDMTQAAGKIAIDMREIAVDLASFSAHKFYGPKGIGGIFVRRGVRVHPLIVGGGQEKNVRSGTVNVPGAVGMAAALDFRAAEMAAEGEMLALLRDSLREGLLAEVPGVSVNGPRALRLPGNLNASFQRVEAESVIMAMRRFSLSSGSACSSGEKGPSPRSARFGSDWASRTPGST
jgi:cysteine desulfurase